VTSDSRGRELEQLFALIGGQDLSYLQQMLCHTPFELTLDSDHLLYLIEDRFIRGTSVFQQIRQGLSRRVKLSPQLQRILREAGIGVIDMRRLFFGEVQPTHESPHAVGPASAMPCPAVALSDGQRGPKRRDGYEQCTHDAK